MLFTNIALFAAVAAALPTPDSDPNPESTRYFLLTVDTPGIPINHAAITASHSRIEIRGDQSSVSCHGPKELYATFAIGGGSKSIDLATTSAPYQPIYVAGEKEHGAVGYTTGAEPPPEGAKQDIFTIDSAKHLLANGIPPTACPPTIDGGLWTLWFTLDLSPAGYKNCIIINLKAEFTNDPSDCHYSY